MQIDFMCAVVEDYIYRMKGVQVKIDRMAIATDQRQMAMLMHAYQIAHGNKEHSHI